MTMHRSLLFFALFVPLAHADPPGPVRACVSDTQAGAGLNLAQALGFGGVIRFACPPGSVIRVFGRYILNASTLIDGGDTIVLDGRGVSGPMLTSSFNVILRRITIRGFAQRPPPRPGFVALGRVTGSLLAARGDAELDRATIENSDFPIEIAGTATIKDSTFSGNRGGATVNVKGDAHIDNSRFTGNLHELSIRSGWVRGCSFNNQTGDAMSVRGATGNIEIRNTTFSGIRGGSALVLSQQAARGTAPVITVRTSTFRDNSGGPAAGAISFVDLVQEARDRGSPAAVIAALTGMPPAAFSFSYNRFTGNGGARAGAIAADLAHSAGLVSTGDLFIGNVSVSNGGALSISGGTARVSHALLHSNRAAGSGAAISIAADASLALSNALAIHNAGPGGTIAGNAVSLTNVTIADNLASGLMIGTTAARAGNIILARNKPADCTGVPAGTFRGAGLHSDGSCPGLATGDAFLDPFYVPAANSPALTAGDPALCRGSLVGGVDLPFQTRLGTLTCALGAFERPPIDKLVSRTDRQLPHADLKDEFTDDQPYQPPPGSDRRTDTGETRIGGRNSGDTTTTMTTGDLRRTARSAPGDTALASVLSALDAEAAMAFERVRVFIVRGNIADDIYLDRINPGRFHQMVNPVQGGSELIVVDNRQWARTSPASPWLNTPARDVSGPVPQMADLFRNGLAGASETTLPDGTRDIEGSISWTNGTVCDGKLLFRIDTTGLPLLLRFDGSCSGRPMRFRQAFSYAGPVSIEAPVLNR